MKQTATAVGLFLNFCTLSPNFKRTQNEYAFFIQKNACLKSLGCLILFRQALRFSTRIKPNVSFSMFCLYPD